MQFSKFAKSKTPAEEPEAKEVEVETSPEVPAAPAPKSNTALSLFDDSAAEAEGSSLLAMAAKAEQSSEGGGGSPMLFPTIQVTGGESGGQWKLVGDVPKEVARMFMPVTGADTLDGVLVGYRVELIAWPQGKRGDDEETTRPAWTAVLPGTAPANLRDLFMAAAEAFNFTPGADKHKFDFAASGVGHIRPSFQALVFVPGPGGCVVVQPPALYPSWMETVETLVRCVDPKSGRLGRFPVRVGIKSRPIKYNNGNSNKVHRLVFDKAMDSQGQEWHESFNAWRAHALDQDPDIVEDINTWLSGADAPITDEIIERLNKAKALKPQR